MSRVFFMLMAGVAAGFMASPAFAEPAMNTFGIPVAPNGGNASIHQWGGIDDVFAVNPDAGDVPVSAPHNNASPLAKEQQDDDSNGPDDPDTEHAGEVLQI